MKHHENGYTLVELALIVFILAAMTAAGAPSVKSVLARHRIQCFARLIVADLRWAQRRAMEDWRDCDFYFSAYSDTICIKSGTKIVKSDPFPEGVSVLRTNFTDNEVTFGCRGNPASGGSIYIKSGDFVYTITVLPVTGRVRIYDYEKT